MQSANQWLPGVVVGKPVSLGNILEEMSGFIIQGAVTTSQMYKKYQHSSNVQFIAYQ